MGNLGSANRHTHQSRHAASPVLASTNKRLETILAILKTPDSQDVPPPCDPRSPMADRTPISTPEQLLVEERQTPSGTPISTAQDKENTPNGNNANRADSRSPRKKFAITPKPRQIAFSDSPRKQIA